eukprot:UN01838
MRCFEKKKRKHRFEKFLRRNNEHEDDVINQHLSRKIDFSNRSGMFPKKLATVASEKSTIVVIVGTVIFIK